MILRRVIEHVKAQNWTAVGLDFVIVVLGVFIGLQVQDWNTGREFYEKEIELLKALKSEIQTDMLITKTKQTAYRQVHAAAGRSIDFIESDRQCGDNCWPVLVDFFLASQWQDLQVKRSTYDEMRRLGLPRSQSIVDAMEIYLAENSNTAIVMIEPPEYRKLVRGLIPREVHDIYWKTCYRVDDGEEFYVEDCPVGTPNKISADAVGRIVDDPNTLKTLIFWYSETSPTSEALEEQDILAKRAIAEIDKELEERP